MAWPWKRFEAMYDSHLKRKAVEAATLVKNAMISGLWSNSNFDDDKGTRTKALDEIEENFAEAVTRVYNGGTSDYDIDWDDPFFAAMKLPPQPGEPVPANLPTTTTDFEIDQA